MRKPIFTRLISVGLSLHAHVTDTGTGRPVQAVCMQRVCLGMHLVPTAMHGLSVTAAHFSVLQREQGWVAPGPDCILCIHLYLAEPVILSCIKWMMLARLNKLRVWSLWFACDLFPLIHSDCDCIVRYTKWWYTRLAGHIVPHFICWKVCCQSWSCTLTDIRELCAGQA